MFKTTLTAIAFGTAAFIGSAHAQAIVNGRPEACLYQPYSDGCGQPPMGRTFHTVPVAPEPPIKLDIAMPPKPMQDKITQCVETSRSDQAVISCISPMIDYLKSKGYSDTAARKNAIGFVNVFTHRMIIEANPEDVPAYIRRSAVPVYMPPKSTP